MKVGIPTEIKSDEYRVGLTPAGTRELTERGHEVIVQANAGEGSVIPDAEYEAQGARIAPDAQAVFADAEMILKVKEPQESEVALLRERQLLFTYLHLAPAPELTKALQESGAFCIAYETVEENGHLPLTTKPPSTFRPRPAASAMEEAMRTSAFRSQISCCVSGS